MLVRVFAYVFNVCVVCCVLCVVCLMCVVVFVRVCVLGVCLC